jgi:hypothetical protein
MARRPGVNELFEGRHFDREMIVLCVRWYLRFKLSFRDLMEMRAERGLSMAHTTIMRWVHHYVPEFERRCVHRPRAQPQTDPDRPLAQPLSKPQARHFSYLPHRQSLAWLPSSAARQRIGTTPG